MRDILESVEWFGTMTIENTDQIVARLRRMLEGKKYTFVAANEFFRYKPEVRTGQRLDPKGCKGGDALMLFSDDVNGKFKGFSVGDIHGVWGCTTTATNEHKHDNYNNPYFHFEWDHTVTITHRAPAGHLLYWVVAVEGED
jgi:hypothetical protein